MAMWNFLDSAIDSIGRLLLVLAHHALLFVALPEEFAKFLW